MNNFRWDAPEYQKMVSVLPEKDHVTIEFQNGDIARISKNSLYPTDSTAVNWNSIRCEAYEIFIPTTNGDTHIPWTTVRLYTDIDFAAHWVKSAEKQAKEIGILLRKLRKARDFTSKDVAFRAGISPQSLSRIENGHHDVVFTTLRKILTAMGCTLSDLASTKTTPTSLRELLNRLESAGIKKELLLDRILPDSVFDKIAEPGISIHDESLSEIANYLSRIFKLSTNQIISSHPLNLDLATIQAGKYKTPARIHEKNTIAYIFYAHYLALLVLQATEHLQYHHPPDDPKEIRNAILEKYGSINFESTLSYIWSLGIPVLPLSDTGAFHGACWYISDRSIIILKQRTEHQGRWLFDLCHELGHVAKHMSAENSNIVEFQEISPFHKFDEEWEASQFASDILFGGKAEKFAQLSVDIAKNKVEYLKSAVVQVSASENVNVDLLANYLAFRLSGENNINWWATANSLQITNPHPRILTKIILMDQINTESLLNEDLDLLKRSLAD